MSNAGAQAYKFYEELALKRVVWAAKHVEEQKFIEFDISNNEVSIPLWSSKSRVKRIISYNPKLFQGVVPFEISWDDFLSLHVPNLKKENRKIGVNLSGKNITGYDRDIAGVIRSVEAYANVSYSLDGCCAAAC